MKTLLAKIFPQSTAANREKFAIHLQAAMDMYGITTTNRKRAFLAQIGVESAQLSATVENLNYSSTGLQKTFRKYFPTAALAQQYARKPEKIANRVYANRLGNGSESSGDGWRFRGRGLIQCTGKSNYAACDTKMMRYPGECVSILDNPDVLAQPNYASLSAAWWWANAGLNALADKLGGSNDTEIFKQICKKVNGGYNGLAERQEIYSRCKKYIA